MNPDDPTSAPIAPESQPTAQPTAPTVSPNNPEAYLNAISDQPETKTRFFSGKIIALLAGAVGMLIVVLIVGAVVNNMKQGSLAEVTTLDTRLNNLRVILGYSQSNALSDSNTVKVVAETNLIAISRQSELSKIYSITDPNNNSNPRDEEVTADLDNAKARGNLDSTYTTTLREQLLSVCSQIEVVYELAKTDEQRETLTKAYNDFQELANRLPSTATGY